MFGFQRVCKPALNKPAIDYTDVSLQALFRKTYNRSVVISTNTQLCCSIRWPCLNSTLKRQLDLIVFFHGAAQSGLGWDCCSEKPAQSPCRYILPNGEIVKWLLDDW